MSFRFQNILLLFILEYYFIFKNENVSLYKDVNLHGI